MVPDKWFLFFVFYPYHQKQFAFIWKNPTLYLLDPTLGYINSPSLCHNLVNMELDYLSLLQNITLVHCSDNIVMTRFSEQEKQLL
jgi:hypothetical protein